MNRVRNSSRRLGSKAETAGAFTLAVGSVLGGNTFDVLNLVVGDVAYRSGSLYHAMGLEETFITLGTMLMTTILLAGMLRRESQGPPASVGKAPYC